MTRASFNDKVVLVTGAAKRVGAVIASRLHEAGARVVLHCHRSQAEAAALAQRLNAQRPDSAVVEQADLLDVSAIESLAQRACTHWGGVDVLVNNASSFYPTPVGEAGEADWDDLVGSNMKAPFFLSQALAPSLAARGGCIVNMVDVYADRPKRRHTVYVMAKAGLAMMTKSLARELGPEVRVNGVAPGVVLWPEQGIDPDYQQEVVTRTALERPGDPDNVASAVLFLARDVDYVTGQILAVDGGRSLNI